MHGQTLASSIDLKLFTKKASILPYCEYAFTAKMFGDCMSIKKQITYGTGSTRARDRGAALMPLLKLKVKGTVATGKYDLAARLLDNS